MQVRRMGILTICRLSSADSMLNKYSLSDNAFEHKKGAPVGKMWYNTYYLQPMQWYVNNQYEEGEH